MKSAYRVSAVVLSLSLFAAPLTARQKPDFSGTWVAVSPTAAAGQVQTVKDGRYRTAKSVWSLNTQGELVVDFTEQFSGQPEKTMRIVSRRTP